MLGHSTTATVETGFDVAEALVVDGWRVRAPIVWRPNSGVWLTAVAPDGAPVDVLIRSWNGVLAAEKIERAASDGPLGGEVARWASVNAARAATDLFELMPCWLVASAGIVVGGPKRDLRGAPKKRTDGYLVAFAHVAERAGASRLGVGERQAQRTLADARVRGLIDVGGQPTDRGARVLEALEGEPCKEATPEQRVYCGRCLLARSRDA